MQDGAERPPPGPWQSERNERPNGEQRAPPRIRTTPDRAPANPRLGPKTVIVPNSRNTARQQPSDHEKLGQIREPRDPCQTHPEVIVLGDRERWIVATRSVERRAAHHHRGVNEGIATNERPPDRCVVLGWANSRHLATGDVDLPCPGPDESYVTVGV